MAAGPLDVVKSRAEVWMCQLLPLDASAPMWAGLRLTGTTGCIAQS